jgi:crooked neck
MPQVVRKRRKLDDGSFEEYFDYLFKDGDEGNQKMLNLLRRLKSGEKEFKPKLQDIHSQPNTFV